jgi:transposase
MKTTKKKQIDMLQLLRNNQKKASKKQQKPRKLGYLTVGERQQVLLLKNLGYSEKDIALCLGCSKKTAYRTLKKFKETGNLLNKPKSGRKRNTTPEIDKEIKDLCNEDRSRTSTQITAMLKQKYHQILIHHAIPSGLRLGGRGFVFQQDNDPKHTSALVKNYLNKKETDGTLCVIQDWPSQSPDINAIELVWEEMDREVQKRKPTNEAALLQVINEVWENIQPEVLQKLIDRLPRVMKAIIQAKGGYFDEKYDVCKFKHQPVY